MKRLNEHVLLAICRSCLRLCGTFAVIGSEYVWGAGAERHRMMRRKGKWPGGQLRAMAVKRFPKRLVVMLVFLLKPVQSARPTPACRTWPAISTAVSQQLLQQQAGAASSSSSRGYAAAVASPVLFACTSGHLKTKNKRKRKQNARTEPKMGNQKIEKEKHLFQFF